MSLAIADDTLTLVQVMAWCHQATNHYMTQFDQELCRDMVSLGHNELMKIPLTKEPKVNMAYSFALCKQFT